MIVIAGGQKDFNIRCIVNAVAARDYDHMVVSPSQDDAPKVIFDDLGHVHLDGQDLSQGQHSLFIRYDVFSGKNAKDSKEALSAQRSASNWYDLMKGWADAADNVTVLNEAFQDKAVNKPRNLVLARQDGFVLPETKIGNHFNDITDPENWIIKPVSGGEHTRILSDVLNDPDALKDAQNRPWIFQRKMDYPELRVFRVGSWLFGFVLSSEHIDHRETLADNMKEIEVPEELRAPMFALTDRLGLDYGAADFKICPETGRWSFLEINTMPMFAGYDVTAKGRLSDAMAIHLHRLQR